MAASATGTTTRYSDTYGSSVNTYTIAWVSASDGTCTFTTDRITGVILRVVFNPGSPTPTDNYDITLSDIDGIDILSGQGANRDTTTTEQICPGVALYDGTTTSVVPIAINGPLSMSITGAGSGAIGTIVIYFR